MIRRTVSFCAFLVFLNVAWPLDQADVADVFPENLNQLPLEQLEQLRDATKAKLNQLANFNLSGGVGTICFRTMPQKHERVQQWVQIDFDRPYPIDEIALIPAIWRDNENGYRDDGFPREFRILAGTRDSDKPHFIASVKAEASILPRVAPLVISGNGEMASWVRIQADLLSTRFHDGSHIMQFSEIMIFSDSVNIALNQKVTASSSQSSGIGAYSSKYLVDGFLPYVMDAAEGQKSNPYFSGLNIGDQASLTIDLKTRKKITHLRLHMIEQGDTVPHALQPNFAVPPHLVFEGANQSDFSDAEILWDFQHRNLYEISHIISKRIDPMSYRYVRIRAIESFLYEGVTNDGEIERGTRLGFAEIEIYSGAQNIARGRPFRASYDTSNHDPNRPLTRLTDGHNIFGEILTTRDWIDQLARRHDLAFQLPLIEQTIQFRYEDQKAKLRLWVGIATVLGALAIIIFLTDRILRQRAIFRTRERIAADLHDELGANLHAIALLGDLALASKDSSQKSEENIERIRALVRRTSKAVKHTTNMLETPGLYQNLPVEMNQISRRLMSDLDHTLEFEGEERFEQIRPRKRIDLFLFYKEALINVLRHSKATVVRSKLTIGKSQLELTVADNGHGIAKETPNLEPPSLKRRARLIGGGLTVIPSPDGGTTIILNMKIDRA